MPLELVRTVRFAVNTPPASSVEPAPPREPAPARNAYAGAPPMRGLGRHYELDVACRGNADPVTGYFVDIREIDRAVRTSAVPVIELACRDRPHDEPAHVMPAILASLAASSLGERLAGVRWWLTPYHSVEMTTERANVALLRQRFDFAASHRLHVAALSPEQNRELFGKCAGENGHGHNYRVEPAVEIPTGPGAPVFTLADLERVTDETVISRFDHKHLNLDTAEFGPGSGLNPSVENIARVIHDLLAPAIRAACPQATLRSVTVWETEKTRCTYPA